MSANVRTEAISRINASFVRHYITTMRPYLMFVSGVTGIAGISTLSDVPAFQRLLVFMASFLSYGFGQALTDCFQTDTDALSSPYRPLTQGIISRGRVLVVSIIGLIGCISVFAFYNPANLIVGTLAGGGLVTYTWFKRRWWGGPFYNAWIVAALCLMAYFTGTHDPLSAFSAPFVWILWTVFFGYANFVLVGYAKDTAADRATGYRTLPVVFGRRMTAVASDVLAVMTLACILVAIKLLARTSHSMVSLLPATAFGAAGIIQLLLAQMRHHTLRDDGHAYRAIGPVVSSYIALLCSIACLARPEWSVFLVLYYAAYLCTMQTRPAQHQI
jgi:geranylgeranylglycerol-phosphate geranylgeranyltransferase